MKIKNNNIQFAVVREDPEVETKLVKMLEPTSEIMLIGSGGCTAFTLAKRFPKLTQTLVDPNKGQIDLIKRKLHGLITYAETERNELFGIDTDSAHTFTACGNFESLFRSLRLFLYEFVMDKPHWLQFFSGECDEGFPEKIFRSKYWPIAFELFFSDSLLIGMFGREAVQHAAEPYPTYFQRMIENGLRASNAQQNYFLHHIFLGHYINNHAALPAYLTDAFPIAQSMPFIFESKFIQDVNSFNPFSLISFSNIFDWMSETDVEMIAANAAKEMRSGAYLVYRQLNNTKNFRPMFGRKFKFDDELACNLYRSDRSLFYSSLHIAQKL